MDIKEHEKLLPAKCIRCVLKRGVDSGTAVTGCVWKRTGRLRPDYDTKPEIGSISTDDIPDDEKGIIRSQMKLLAERSRFMRAEQLVQVTEAMTGLYKCLMGNAAELSDKKE